jgi:Leucine-rich repeat (LRR) protein
MLRSLEALRCCSSLQKLTLNGNHICSVGDGLLPEKLTFLSLASNKLRSLEGALPIWDPTLALIIIEKLRVN